MKLNSYYRALEMDKKAHAIYSRLIYSFTHEDAVCVAKELIIEDYDPTIEEFQLFEHLCITRLNVCYPTVMAVL